MSFSLQIPYLKQIWNPPISNGIENKVALKLNTCWPGCLLSDKIDTGKESHCKLASFCFCKFIHDITSTYVYLIVCIQQECSVCQHIFFNCCFCWIGRYHLVRFPNPHPDTCNLGNPTNTILFLNLFSSVCILDLFIWNPHVWRWIISQSAHSRWLAWCWAQRATFPPGCLLLPSASSSMLPSCPCSLRSRCFFRTVLNETNYWSRCKFSKANSLAGILLNTLGMAGGALLLLGIGLYEPELEAFFGGEHDH